MDDRRTFLRPSGAAVWTVCAAYLRACVEYAALPDTADEIRVREEGTACHWLAERVLQHGHLPTVGTLAPNGVAIDDDMWDAVNLYREHIGQECGAIEVRLDCGIIYPGMEGSPDHANVIHARRALRIDDLKYGYGYVDEFENLQLSIYALTVAHQHNLPDDYAAELSIVQPRAITNEGPVRTWKTTVGWLRQNMLGFLQRAAVMAMGDCGATAGLHCLDCPGRFTCSTHINMAREVCRHTGKSVPMNLSPAALGAELRIVRDALKVLEGRKESLQAQVESHMRNGRSIPGWQFTPSKGREAYLPGMEKAFLGAAKLYGVDASRPVSPSEARRLLPTVVVDAFVNRPKAGLALKYVGAKEVEKSFNK